MRFRLIQQAGMRTRRGFSLAEILVVLVILIFGIFAIVRLFPEGFVAINHSANTVLADALVRRNEDSARKFAENLPLGISGIDPATGQIRLGILPGDLLVPRPYTDNTIAGYSGPLPDDPRFSYINAARYVQGESFRVPPPTVNFALTGETVSLYHVLYSPIYSAQPMGGAAAGISCHSGTPLQRVVFQDPPTDDNWDDLTALGVFGYGVSYSRNELYFLSAPYERTFKIEFSYHTGPDTVGQSPPNNCVYIASNATPNQRITYSLFGGTPQPPNCPFTPLPGAAQLDPGSDFLFRRYTQIPLATAFGADPYEFKVYDTIFGLLGFNPLGASIPLPSQSARGLTARVDYDVDDWMIMRQDETIPLDVIDGLASGPNRMHAIKLATVRIKRVGDVEDIINLSGSGSVTAGLEYQGLIRNYPAGASGPARPGSPSIDLVVVDIETGLMIDSRTLQRPGTTPLPGVSDTNGTIDYSAGVIHLRHDAANNIPMWSPPASIGGSPRYMNPAGRHVRIYYRTYNDFGVASFKPYSNYVRALGLPTLGAQQYFPVAGGYLLFNNMDAEKTVAVDYSYLNTVSNQVVNEIGEMHKLAGPGTAGDPGLGRWWLRLGRSADPDIDPASIQITAVRGASFQTHVMWRDGNRWRSIRRSTVLTSGK